MKILREVSKDQFFKDWDADNEASDRINPVLDQNSRDRLAVHETQATCYYYRIQLDESDLAKLVLPDHNHTIKVPPAGLTMVEYGDQKLTEFENGPINDTCIKRIRSALQWFYDPTQDMFMYISDSKGLALGESYSGRDNGYLYAGSSHKFAAYSIFVKKHGFKPVEMYLATYNKRSI